MKNRIFICLILFVFIFIGSSFVSKTEAQGVCSIESANFSPSGILLDFLKSGGNISINVKTNNCVGKTIFLTILGTRDDEFNQSNHLGMVSSPLTVSKLAYKAIDIPNSGNLKINLIANEESCVGRDSWSERNGVVSFTKYDCAYYFYFGENSNSSFNSFSSSGGSIIYNCFGECEDQQKPWTFVSTTELENNSEGNDNNPDSEESENLNNSGNGNYLPPKPVDLSTSGSGLTVACPKTGCGFNELLQLINKVVNFILFDMVVPIAAIMFAYAGFLLLFSGGDTEKRSKAKSIFINVAIGFIIAVAAWLIVEYILNLLGYNQTFNWFGF